jgi:hypothetical protein
VLIIIPNYISLMQTLFLSLYLYICISAALF